jgi:hypothetical protein
LTRSPRTAWLRPRSTCCMESRGVAAVLLAAHCGCAYALP